MGKESAHIDQQYDRQLEVNREQNAWQAAENNVDRQWQANEWTRQFEAQVQAQRDMYLEQLHAQKESDMAKWREQFEAENRYNSPGSQVARLMAAGINPAAAVSQIMGGNASSAGAGTSSSPAAASAPSGGSIGSHSVSPLGVSVPAYSTDSALFTSAAQLADSMAKLGELGLANERQQATLGATVENLMSDTQSKQEQAAITRTQNAILQATGDKKVIAEINRLNADAYAAYKRGDYDQAQQITNRIIANVQSGEYGLKVEQQPYVINALEAQAKMYKSQSVANYASANASNASARLSNALAATEDGLRDGKIKALDLANTLSDIQNQLARRENVRDATTNDAQIHRVLEAARREDLISSQVYQQVQKAITDNDWNAVEHFFGVLSNACQSVGSVGNVMVGSKRNEIQQRFNNDWLQYQRDYMNQKFDNKHTPVNGFPVPSMLQP